MREHALLRFLANEIEQVVARLAAIDGSTFYVDGGHVVSVFPFLEGEELRSREALFRQDLPAFLARMHRHAEAWPVTEQRPGVPSLRERNWDRNDWWDWSLVERPASLVRGFEELREWVGDADDLASPRSTANSIQETSSCAMGALLASSIGSTRAGTGLLSSWLGWSGTCHGTRFDDDRSRSP